MTDHAPGYPKVAIFNLLLATLFNFFVAFSPLWALAVGANFFEKFMGLFHVVTSDSSAHFQELLQIFWLPFIGGMVCLVALLVALLIKPAHMNGRLVLLFPLVTITTMLLYVLVTRLD